MHVLDICKQFELFGKGIGNETRFKILTALYKGERSVNELATFLDLSQPSTSQHLKVLKAGGLIVGVKSGQEVYYHIDKENVVRLLTLMLDSIKDHHLSKKNL